MTYSHNLERVELGQGVILLQGWVAWDDACRPVLQLHGRDSQGHPWVQTIAFNRDRPDVVGALGLAPTFQRCGFYYAAVPEGQVLELCAHTDGACLSLHRWADASAPPGRASDPNLTPPLPSRLHQPAG